MSNLYDLLVQAAAFSATLYADYPNADEDDEAENDPRWEDWHDLMRQAEALVPEESRDLLCAFESSMSRNDLQQMLIDDGAIEFYPS